MVTTATGLLQAGIAIDKYPRTNVTTTVNDRILSFTPSYYFVFINEATDRNDHLSNILLPYSHRPYQYSSSYKYNMTKTATCSDFHAYLNSS